MVLLQLRIKREFFERQAYFVHWAAIGDIAANIHLVRR